MLNVIAKAEQTVAAGQNIVFTNTRVKSRRCGCSSGWLNHIEGSGIFTITNRTSGRNAFPGGVGEREDSLLLPVFQRTDDIVFRAGKKICHR